MSISRNTGTFLDSSIILNAIVETELSRYAEDAMRHEPLLTSETVINEVLYVLVRKLFAENGIRNRYDVKERLSTEMGRGSSTKL